MGTTITDLGPGCYLQSRQDLSEELKSISKTLKYNKKALKKEMNSIKADCLRKHRKKLKTRARNIHKEINNYV